MAEEDTGVTVFPSPSGSKLDVHWGVGREVFLGNVVVRTGEEVQEAQFGSVQWDEPSSAQRQVAYDTMKLYRALHTQALQDQDKMGRLQSILEYSQEITSVLKASYSRPAAQDQGQQSVMEDCCAWQLLQLFYMLLPRMEGLVTQDLVVWMKDHNVLLSRPGASAHEAFFGVCGDVQEHQAAPQTVPGYWQAFQRLVLLGWTEDARDVLYVHSDLPDAEERLLQQNKSASSQLLEQVDALLKCMPQSQSMSGKTLGSDSPLPPVEYAQAREQWQAECVKVLDSPRYWDECQQTLPETAEALRVTLSIMSGDREVISNLATSWLELLIGMLLYGLPTKVATRHAIGPIIGQCLSVKADPGIPSAPGLFLTLMEELLPAVSEMDTSRVLSACSQLSLWFKAHMPDILTATPQGKAVLGASLEHEGGDMSEKLTLAYAHSLMAYPTTWHVAAAYLAWCPCHGAAAMEQLLSQLPIQGDSRLAHQVLQQCQLYGLPQVAVGLCRQMGVHHWQKGRTAAALAWLIRGHDESRASQAAAPLTQEIEAMLGDSSAGFQPIPALANLEGLLNILAPASSVADDENVLPSSQSKAKEQDLVQHKGCLGFLQGFLKLQQAMEEVKLAQDQSQLQKGASAVCDVVMALVGCKIAPQRTWLHILFHTIPVLENCHPPVFNHRQIQQLLSRVQERAVWIPKDIQHQHQQNELMVVRLALARSVAQAHLSAVQPAVLVKA